MPMSRFKLLFRKHWCLLIICSLCVILAITLYEIPPTRP